MLFKRYKYRIRTMGRITIVSICFSFLAALSIYQVYTQLNTSPYTDADPIEPQNPPYRDQNGDSSSTVAESTEKSASPVVQRSAKFVMYIRSWPADFKGRHLLRRIWAKDAVDVNIPTYFVCGKANDTDVQTKFLDEMRQKTDILYMPSFYDQYERLTVKMQLVFEHFLKHYDNDTTIFYINSDAIVDVPKLIDFINHNQTLFSATVIGHCTCHGRCAGNFARRETDIRQRHYISDDLWPAAFFPSFCGGQAGVMSYDLTRRIYTMSKAFTHDYLTNFDLDDVFYTAIIRNMLGIPMGHYPSLFCILTPADLPKTNLDCLTEHLNFPDSHALIKTRYMLLKNITSLE